MTLVRRVAAATGVAIALVAGGLGASRANAGQPTAKVVRFPLPRYDGTLTPYSFDLGYPLVTLVYDTLMWRDADGIPQPWLARSVKRGDRGRRVTIRLRKGVRWHDGRPLTAADVQFTFRFFARRFQASFTPQLANIERVRAVGRDLLTIELRRPSLGFDDQPLSDVPILPKHLWQGLEGTQRIPSGPAVGSGPYRLVRSGPRDGYDFRANTRYFLGRPLVGRIRVPIIRDEERTYRAIQRREVDMLPVPLNEGVAKDLGEASSITVDRGPSYIGTALVLNLRHPPFDRLPARTAVAQSLNLSRVLRNTGPGVPADRGSIHPDSRWAPGEILQRENLPAARRAFASLRLAPIEVLAPENDGVRLEAGRQVVLALRRAGARAQLKELSSRGLHEAVTAGDADSDFDAAIVSTPALASYDPNFLSALFGSDPDTAPLNYSGYRSAAFDALAARVVAAPDSAKRRRAVAAELKLLANDAPMIPLFFSDASFAYRQSTYDGWVFIKGAGILDKRSFLPGQARAPAPETPATPPESSGSDSTSNAIRTGALVILAIAALLAVAGLVSRLSRRRR